MPREGTPQWFLMTISNFRNILEAKAVSSIMHSSGRLHSCVRCHSAYEDLLMRTTSSYFEVAEAMKT